MSDIEKKISKEWLNEALGGLNPTETTESVISEETLEQEAVILLSGTNSFGDPIYSYIKFKLKHYKDLRRAMMAGQDFKPSDFGEVVAAGRGEPPQEVRDEMKVKYNMVDVTRRLKANEERSRRGVPRNFAQPAFFGDDDD